MNAEPQPTSVRLIRGAKDWIHQRARILGIGGVVLVALLWLGSGLHTIKTGESAAVLRWGRLLDDALAPGLHLRLPSGVDETIRVQTGEVSRLAVRGDRDPELTLLTGDYNLIEASLVVQYRISRLGDFLFAAEDPELLLNQVVRAAAVDAFASTPVDPLLTTAKAEVQNQLRERVQQRLDRYASGITVVAVTLQSVDPPPEAAAAFRAVNDSRAEAAQTINQAEAKRGSALRLARGRAERLVGDARATSDSRIQQGRGAAERFESVLRQYREAPGQTRTELYFNTLEETLPKAEVIVLAPGQTPDIDLHLLPERPKDEKLDMTLPPELLDDHH